jgi:hypothetical protein
MISRQRKSQLLHPERQRARDAINDRVQRGKMSKPSTLTCIDCGNKAECYDHARGYIGENRLYVEPVCWPCHRIRGKIRNEYKNGTTISYVRFST